MELALLLSVALAVPQFKVRCDLGGEHGADPDRLPPALERSLVLDALNESWPLMPDHLREIAPQVTFVIDHLHPRLTKLVPGGWSAEDDPDYRYPDRAFYPAGTIKVSLTERLLQMFALLREVSTAPDASPALKEAGLRWPAHVLIHELMHAWQFHTGPVRDLSHPGAVKDGLPDEDALAGAGKKVEYEHQAFALGRSLLRAPALLAMAEAFDARRAAHPAEFQPGGRYGLSGDQVSAWPRREAPMVDQGGAFSPGQKAMIAAQYELPRAVSDLHRLNERKSGSAEERARIDARWSEFRAQGELGQSQLTLMPFLAAMEARYRREQRAFDARTAASGPRPHTPEPAAPPQR